MYHVSLGSVVYVLMKVTGCCCSAVKMIMFAALGTL